MPKILIIEDDTSFCQMLRRFLTKNHFDVSISYSAREAEAKLNEHFDVILSDVRLPQGDGMALLSQIKRKHPQTQVILMTGYADIKTAVRAVKKGAFDYIPKPFTPEEILSAIKKALKNDFRIAETKNAKEGQTLFLIGKSKSAKKLEHYVDLVAPTDMSVLLVGESGTGKEVTAKSIHRSSKRKGEPFVAVDCGAIPKEIATSEFFGHVKGSFTGAFMDKTGHFEAANGGTLFLDEVGNLSYEHQIQLLRAIQERRIKRVGSTTEIQLDLRIIAATNENLTQAVQEGKFREDLYHRLNEFTIMVPSLKARREDIMLFANYFLQQSNVELGKHILGFSEQVELLFHHHDWPGNLREMKNMVKRAVLFTEGETITVDAIPEEIAGSSGAGTTTGFSKSEYEKERIMSALKRTNFNKSKAAKLLQMTRKTLYNKINLYQLEV